MSNFEISWFGPHFGEEPPISGPSHLVSQGGSGTIFFCRCNLRCIYCQNWQISQESISCRKVDGGELTEMMLILQEKGCHNINLVSPTMWSSALKEVIEGAKKKGLKIPVVWNTNGYEPLGILGKLEGLVDIYLPDFKYADKELAVKYSNAPNYPEVAQKAVLEMQRQVGDLAVDENGIALRGLVVRHLVLPGYLENTRKCLEFIRSISEGVHLSLMSQYNPTYRAKEFPEINRPLKKEEWEKVLQMIKDLDFKFGWIQEFGGAVKCLNPDFCQESPFK